MARVVLLVLFALAIPTTGLAAGQAPQGPAEPSGGSVRIRGTVRDVSGAAVPGAKVVLQIGKFRATRTTDRRGGFSIDNLPAASGTLTVRAPGFEPVQQSWNAPANQAGDDGPSGPRNLEVALRPQSVSERITVTATRTRTRLGDTAADVAVLTSEDLSSTAALTTDDKLRQVPGFSLFRRSGSRAANPTSQGVSLRGVGASGASRALVLEDGIPLNDPFGGWVYWDRVPTESVGAVELVQGGSSDLYGSDALGGVINVVTRRVDQSGLSLDASYGNENTPDASLASSLRWGRWASGFSAETFHTSGYFLVPDDLRGPVDSRAGVDYRSGVATVERVITDQARVFARASYLGEQRENGKVDERNHTEIRQVALGGDWQSASLGAFSLRAYGGPQTFDQNFFAVAPDRSSESLTRVQRVPAQQIGFTAQWSRPAGARQTLVAGVDGNGVRGASDEFLFKNDLESSAVGAGGRQRTVGVFGEDILRLTSRWIVTAGARYDHWLNYRALSVTQPLATPGPAAVTDFAGRAEQAFSPRLSVLRRVTENLSLTGSVYRAFRAPTLNELYRTFRLGNILTLANADLRAERLTGAEAGATWTALAGQLTTRGTFFWSDTSRPISNVTLSTTPALITRERENLGRTRSRGIELEVTGRLTPTLSISSGYEFTNATVVGFPANTALVGLRIPEVPRHEATFQLRYANPDAAYRLARLTAGIQGRAESAAYDDDLNTLRLKPYFTLDALVSRPLARGLEVYAAAENLTGQRYEVALTPATNLGPPRLARVGIRLQLGNR